MGRRRYPFGYYRKPSGYFALTYLFWCFPILVPLLILILFFGV
jgi:hypothetical protein